MTKPLIVFLRSMRGNFFIKYGFVVFLFGLCVHPVYVVSQDSKDYSELITTLDSLRAKYNIPSYALIISDDKRILVDEVNGVESATSSAAVSTKAYFRIGSITKTFIGLAALVAENENKLDLDDPISSTLGRTQLNNPFSKTNQVTLAQLLEHSAGLTDMSREEFSSNDPMTLKEALDKYKRNRKTHWAPGQFHSYSNLGYGLAGRVIEKTTESSINDWVTQKVFKPLGMTSATMLKSAQVDKHLVPGYQANGVDTIPYWHMAYSSLGAINLQPRDMAKLIQLYLGKNNLAITPKNIQRQETPKTTLAASKGLAYGYGLGLYQWYENGFLFYGHGGDADGYLSHFGYQKDINRGYFFVINTFNNRAKRHFKREIESFMTRGHKPNKQGQIDKVDLKKDYQGSFAPVTFRFKRKESNKELLLEKRNESYFIKEPGGDWSKIYHLGSGRFRRGFEGSATMLVFSHKGKLYLSGDEGNYVQTTNGD